MEASPARAYTGAADSGADAIVGALAQAGTRLVFGVPGGGPNLDVVGAADAAGLRFILAHGETAAVIMAATCADLAGPPGAVVFTRGPGLASAVNGIAQGGDDAVWCRPVSFAAAATAMGAAGAAVSTERDLATALAAALRRPGPTVIDASVDPAGYPAVMDLSRGQAGRRSVSGISRALGVPCP
jgi:thiamine pyrophosphate-dependent acetolactate synthase large subunit-like protein